MNSESEIKKDFETIAGLVIDMYDLMDSYQRFEANSVDDFPRMAVIKKTEKRIEEEYPKFKHIKRVEEIYLRLCPKAETFYQSKPAKDLFKMGFKGFTIPKSFQDYIQQKK